jgi:outer membrane immunogenic protein
MRRSNPALLAAVLLVLSAGVALAADYPRKPRKKPPPYVPPPAYVPPPLPAPYDWTGFYFGGNVGGGWANAKSDFSAAGSPVFASANNSLTGILGGAQVGYNWQSGPTVFGWESDFQFSGVKGQLDAPACPAAVCGVPLSASYSQKMPWFGTVRGRVGYASDMWLMYATGGYAYARLESEATASAGGATATVSRKETRSGWTVGGGIEVALSRQWTAKVEYLYIDLGTRQGSWALTGLPDLNDSVRVYENLVRAGLNYRF